jgi:hypothetical protein
MTAPPEPEDEPNDPSPADGTMRAALYSVGASAIALAFGALALFGARAALGVAIGGAIATANLAVFARLGDAFIARKGNTAPWGVIALFKLVFLFGGIWLILKSDIVSGLSLAVGYGALPLGITLGSLFGPKPPDDADLGGKPGRGAKK